MDQSAEPSRQLDGPPHGGSYLLAISPRDLYD
jgi:hypothetical protein